MTDKEILIRDYEITQAFIDKIDQYLFWIRNWTIVLCSAVLVFAVTNHNIFLLFCNIIILVGFLFLELIQKSFHEDAMKHSYEVEEILQSLIHTNNQIPQTYHFGLGHAINKVSIKKLKVILIHKGRWHNIAFYGLILIFTFLASFTIPFIPNLNESNRTDSVNIYEYNVSESVDEVQETDSATNMKSISKSDSSKLTKSKNTSFKKTLH